MELNKIYTGNCYCGNCEHFEETRCQLIKECPVTVETYPEGRVENEDFVTQYGNNFSGNWARVGPQFGCVHHSEQQSAPGFCENCMYWEEHRRCNAVAFWGDWSRKVLEKQLNFYSDNPFQNWLEVGPKFGCVRYQSVGRTTPTNTMPEDDGPV